MKNKIIAAILLMGILWNGQMVYAEDTAVGEVIATESENSESKDAKLTKDREKNHVQEEDNLSPQENHGEEPPLRYEK